MCTCMEYPRLTKANEDRSDQVIMLLRYWQWHTYFSTFLFFSEKKLAMCVAELQNAFRSSKKKAKRSSTEIRDLYFKIF